MVISVASTTCHRQTEINYKSVNVARPTSLQYARRESYTVNETIIIMYAYMHICVPPEAVENDCLG